MPLLKFRVYWEEDDLIYRDIEILSGQTFMDLHQAIIKAYEFDGKHSASFFVSNDKWQRLRELSSEVMSNKKDAPALSMIKTPVSALVAVPDQKFVYVYDPARSWTFLVELIGVSRDEDSRKVYPVCSRKEGLAPAQYGARGANAENPMIELEEKYDLGADEMAEGFGNEGDGTDSSEESYTEDTGSEDF